jgi:hypothetical protein
MSSISEARLRTAIQQAGLPNDTWPRIQAALAAEPELAAKFEAAHIAYYLGALLIIGAMGWFITSAWDTLSSLTLSGISLAYAVAFGAVGLLLSRRQNTRIPGGILLTVAVSMTPMIVYGIERQFHIWPSGSFGKYSDFHPYIRASWVYMEVFTLLASLIALRFVRFPFIAAPGAYAAWYLSMDATALLFGRSWTFSEEAHISVAFGLAMMLVAYFLDGDRDVDLAFWFYLFGLLTFTGGLTLWGNGSQLGKAVYCLIHVALILLSVVLQRRAFLVFGALGVFFYVGNEASTFFRNSVAFTFFVSAIGVAFIAAGIVYKRNEQGLARLFSPLIPARVRHRHSGAAALQAGLPQK